MPNSVCVCPGVNGMGDGKVYASSLLADAAGAVFPGCGVNTGKVNVSGVETELGSVDVTEGNDVKNVSEIAISVGVATGSASHIDLVSGTCSPQAVRIISKSSMKICDGRSRLITIVACPIPVYDGQGIF